jgi:hypothetical protein
MEACSAWPCRKPGHKTWKLQKQSVAVRNTPSAEHTMEGVPLQKRASGAEHDSTYGA